MKELIKVETNEQGQKLVSGRELHGVLEIKTQFTKWIQRMIDYGFQENIDYTLVIQKRLTNNPKNPYTEETDYILTLEMAKHIAMVQRTEIGMQVRNYFLECEKAALQQAIPSYMITDPIERAKCWIKEEEARQELTLELQQKEQENKQLVVEVEHKEDVIIGLTKDITLAEKRQRITQIIKFNANKRFSERYGLLYSEFDKKYHIDSKRRLNNAIERGEVKRSTKRMDFICEHMQMTNDLYDVCVKVFEADFIDMLEDMKKQAV